MLENERPPGPRAFCTSSYIDIRSISSSASSASCLAMAASMDVSGVNLPVAPNSGMASRIDLANGCEFTFAVASARFSFALARAAAAFFCERRFARCRNSLPAGPSKTFFETSDFMSSSTITNSVVSGKWRKCAARRRTSSSCVRCSSSMTVPSISSGSASYAPNCSSSTRMQAPWSKTC